MISGVHQFRNSSKPMITVFWGNNTIRGELEVTLRAISLNSKTGISTHRALRLRLKMSMG